MDKIEKNSIPEPNSGCWIWTKAVDRDGYGRIWYEGETQPAHRISFLNYKGPLGNYQVLHKCDNPSCVNPDHLFLGTNQDNMIDKKNKGRCNPPIGVRSGTAKLTDDVVRSIRAAEGKYKELSKIFGISPAQICRIKSGTRWSHVT